MCGVCLPPPLPWRILAHPTPTYVDIKFLVCWRCLTLPQPHDCSTISAVKLSYRDRNGTGRTLDAKTTNTNPFETNHPHTLVKGRRRCVVSNTVQQTQTQQSFLLFAANTCSRQHISLSPTHTKRGFLCRCISTSHLQHVTMLTALAYQPHHLQGTSTETSS